MFYKNLHQRKNFIIKNFFYPNTKLLNYSKNISSNKYKVQYLFKFILVKTTLKT